MICYFLSRNWSPKGIATTEIRDSMLIKDDRKTEEIEAGIDVFSGYLCYGAVASQRQVEEWGLPPYESWASLPTFYVTTRAQAEAMTRPGNYILRHVGTKNDCYTIIECETNVLNKEIYFYAESAGIDLIGTECEEYENDQEMTLAQYASLFLAGTGFQIGRNQSSGTKILSWGDAGTATSRLLSLASSFGCELAYRFEFNRLGVLAKYVDFMARRGTGGVSVATKELRRGRDFDEFRVKKTIQDVATELIVRGGTPNGGGIYRADNGTYTWVKFSETYNGMDGGGEPSMQDDPDGMYYIGIAAGKSSEVESEDPSLYTWELVSKEPLMIVVPSTAGHQQSNLVNGTTRYTWVMFGTDSQGSNISDQPTGRSYVGLAFNKGSSVKSTLPDDYTWFPMNGSLSHRDLFVSPGTDAVSEGGGLYTWLKFADDALGSGMSDSPIGKSYCGVSHHRATPTKSSDPDDYIWREITLNTTDGGFVRAKAAYSGVRRQDGTYIWFKFLKSATDTAVSSKPSGRPYIGLAYGKSNANASFVKSDYSWTLYGDDNTAVTISGLSYDDGDIYIDAADGRLKSRAARLSWAADVTGIYESDVTTPQLLLDRAITELKRRREPVAIYELELARPRDDLAIGNLVRIADVEAELFLTARIIKLETSEASKTCSITLDDFAAP